MAMFLLWIKNVFNYVYIVCTILSSNSFNFIIANYTEQYKNYFK